MAYKGSLSLRTLLSSYRWDPQLATPENHRAELQGLFQRDPNATPSHIRKVLGEHLVQPDRFFRKSDEQRAAAQLTQQLQEKIFNRVLAHATVIEENKQLPISSETRSMVGRGSIFFHTSLNDPNYLQFNEQMLNAYAQWNTNPEILQNMILTEVNALRDKLGLNTPDGLQKLASLTDAELVEKFDDIVRYQQMLLQAADSDTDKYLTPEQKQELLARSYESEFLQNFETRYNAIANPYYADLNYELLYDQNIDSTEFYDTMKERIPEFTDFTAKYNTLNNFFEFAQTARAINATGTPSLVATLKPELADQLQSMEAKAALDRTIAQGSPYMLLAPDGEQYVISNKPRLTKIPTAQEYSEELLTAAVKADKWLLTGSKQFDTMMRAQKALNEAQDEGVSAEKLKGLAENLEKAARDYLTYKNSGFKEYTGPASVRGKNMREQSRLEAAGNILNYAKAQLKVMPKLIEMEQKIENQAKLNDGKKMQQFTRNRNSRQFVVSLPENTQAALARPAPYTESTKKTNINGMVLDRGVKNYPVPQEQFSALCALACGSGEVYIAHSKTVKVDGKVQYTYTNYKYTDEKGVEHVERRQEAVRERYETKNDNPSATFDIAITAILDGPKVYDTLFSKNPAKAMVTAAQSNVFYAVKNGNYEALGKMVADGLKQNNAMINRQKGFTREFCAGVNLIDQALKAMDGNKSLKEAVERNLDPSQLKIAKALKALHNVYVEGLEAQNRVLTHLATPNSDLNDPTFIKNVATVCNMYGTSKDFADNKVDLSTLDPATYPKTVENNINSLADNSAVRNYISDLSGKSLEEKLNAVAMSSKMNALHKEVFNQQVLQPSQPQPQLNLSISAPSVQQEQPKPMQNSGLF